VWENGSTTEDLDLVRSIQPGDRMAIKSTFTRKHGLPFDSRGKHASVMRIKAVGTVTGNAGDGRHLTVDWQPLDPPRDWYFYTQRGTVWRVERGGSWMADALIPFAFEGAEQDLSIFLNRPHWRSLYGHDDSLPHWIDFYEELATRLSAWRHDRPGLIEKVRRATEAGGGIGIMNDRYADGTTGPLRDIDPYTVFALFNRGAKTSSRIKIAEVLRRELGVEAPPPASFEGLPIANNQQTWFIRYEAERGEGDVELLWDVFEASLEYADAESSEGERLISKFDRATSLNGVKWNLTMGLFWTRPHAFVPLDAKSRKYIERKLHIPISSPGGGGPIGGADYLDLLARLRERLQEEDCPVHSVPELSLKADEYANAPDPVVNGSTPPTPEPEPEPIGLRVPYGIDDVVNDGCFVDPERLRAMLLRLHQKRCMVLQGPPGTGKTWLAKRLAFALMKERAPDRLVAIQFHPNMSYEDFVRGWRPQSDGKLGLVDGPLLEIAERAREEP
ncbi:AAA family ATPase, partial [bacterium]